VSIHATAKAFAVLYQDQTIFTWGDARAGGGATTYITQAEKIAFVADVSMQNVLTSAGAAIETIQGSAQSDTFTITDLNVHKQYDGGTGMDSLVLKGRLKDYQLTQLPTDEFVLQSETSAGVVCMRNIEQVQFNDMLINLQIAEQAARIPEASLQQLIQLYIGFFNRIPESTGLSYWIDQLLAGQSLLSIANQFYQAGVGLGVYQAQMADSDFIIRVYDHVLGRSGEHAPSKSEISYWQTFLAKPNQTEGAMVIQMLTDAYANFSANPEVSWVVDLLDNKASFAHWYAIEQGLAYQDVNQNINQGNVLASLISSTSIEAAISLVGVTPVYRFEDVSSFLG